MVNQQITQVEVEKLRDQINAFIHLLRQVLKNPSLSKNSEFLHQVQETICSLNESSKL